MVQSGLLVLFLLGVSACITSQREQELRDDMFALQKRVLSLEDEIQSREESAKSDGKTATKVLASTQTELDRVNVELRKIRGDIDQLRVGVMTGQLPGTESSEGGGESVAGTLSQLSTRMDALEGSQQEILSAINQLEGAGKPKRDREAIKGLAGLKAAFGKQQFKAIVEDAPGLARQASSKDREEIIYLHAESLYKLGRLRDAALRYHDLIEKYPASEHGAHSKLRMGDCFRHLGDRDTARSYYEDLLKNHPTASEADKAKERLADLDSKKGGKAGGGDGKKSG